MDSRATVSDPNRKGHPTREQCASGDPEPTAARTSEATRTVCCDQAIFTSLPSCMGSGYRIVAASRGLRPAQRQEITSRSPSHGGLCDESPTAMAVTYYPLSDGRFGIAHTCTAGVEHTGRGGQTVYTRVVVVPSDGFALFADNPFNVVRAMERSGVTAADLKPTAVLPQLELSPLTRDAADVTERTLRPPGSAEVAAWRAQLLRVLAGLMDGEALVVALDHAGLALAEALIMALPARLRRSISFSTGLRFSSARATKLNCVCGDLARTRELLRGHPVVWLDLRATPQDSQAAKGPTNRDPLTPADSPPRRQGTPTASSSRSGTQPAATPNAWLQIVDRRWSQGRCADILTLTQRNFGDASPAVCDRVGRICLDLDALAAADLGGTIELLRRYIAVVGETDVEFELVENLLLTGQRRLSEQVMTAPPHEAIETHGESVVNLALDSPEAAALLMPACARLLRRTCAHDIVLAAHWGAAVAANAIPRQISAAPEALSDILSAVLAALPRLSGEQAAALRDELSEWSFVPQIRDRLAEVQGAVDERLRHSGDQTTESMEVAS